MLTALRNRGVAVRLAQAGFFVFPCHSGGEKAKQPMPFIKWRDVSTTELNRIQTWWDRWPEAAVGLDLAKSRLLVVDADRHGKADGVEAMGQLMASHHYEPDGVPMAATPNQGTHFFYRQPDGKQLGNSAGKLAPGIDTRGHGGYVIAPGTVMQDGRLYEVFGDLADAPTLPAWISELLEAEKVEPKPLRQPVQRTEHSDARIQAYCDAAIAAETDRVRCAGKGTRNNTLNEAAFALGQLVGANWVTDTEIEGFLTNAAAECGLKQPEIRKTIRSGIDAGKRQPRALQDTEPNPEHAEAARRLIENFDGTLADAETGEVIESAPVPANQSDLTDFPPGLVGEIAQWIVSSARRPQRTLAIGAALTLVGVAAGRHICGPTQAGTALYLLGLAPTASGKDHPLKCISRILTAADMGHHIGPSEFISMTSIINMLMRKPLCLAPMDEFGDFMRRVYSRRGSNHERAIPKILRTLWSANFGTVTTPEWAGKQSEKIHAPHLSLFGVSTTQQFYTALENGAAADGTLNRFLIITEPVRAPDRDPIYDPGSVPTVLVSGMKQVFYKSGQLASATRNDATANPEALGKLTRLGWENQAAHDAWIAYTTEIDGVLSQDEKQAEIYARGPETSIRIATIVAAGRMADSVSVQDVEFGILMARTSIKAVMEGTEDYMAENDNAANAQKIRRILKSHKGTIKHRDLVYAMRHSMRARELRDLIALMCDSGELERFEIATKSGPDASGYRLSR